MPTVEDQHYEAAVAANANARRVAELEAELQRLKRKEANVEDDDILVKLRAIEKMFALRCGLGHTDSERLLNLEVTIELLLALLQKGLDE